MWPHPISKSHSLRVALATFFIEICLGELVRSRYGCGQGRLGVSVAHSAGWHPLTTAVHLSHPLNPRHPLAPLALAPQPGQRCTPTTHVPISPSRLQGPVGPLLKLPQIASRDPGAGAGPAAATPWAIHATPGAPRYPRYYSQHARYHPCCSRTAYAV